MNKAVRIGAYTIIAVGFLLASCSNRKTEPAANSAPIGRAPLQVISDPGLEPVMKQQQFIYESLNGDSVKLSLTYKSEADMLTDFKNRRADMMVFSRHLTDNEKQSLISTDTLYTREIAVAYDAVAIIGNPQYDDSKLDTAQLRNYFNPANGNSTNPKMVFDNRNTSVVNYMLNYLGYTNKVSSNLYAVQSPEEVISYVAANKNAIGFIPYTLVADEDDDAGAQKVLKQVKVLSLHIKTGKGEARQVSANQSDIAEGVYPLTRTVCTIMRYSYDDPAWQFVSFLTKEKAARIFLKAGMVPLQIPFREINVNTDGFKGIN